MKLIAWNCQGLGNRPTLRGLLDLQKKEDPDILFLCETGLDRRRMEKFRDLLGLHNMEVRNNDGKSGGLALLWRRGINVMVRWMGRMHIDAIVEEEDGFKWRLTGIYEESHMERKVETWRLLRTLQHQINLPWVCMGDFNEVLFSHEKQGGVPRAHRYMQNFRDALDFCNLHDLRLREMFLLGGIKTTMLMGIFMSVWTGWWQHRSGANVF